MNIKRTVMIGRGEGDCADDWKRGLCCGVNVSICRCFDMSMCRSAVDVSMCRCFDVSMIGEGGNL